MSTFTHLDYSVNNTALVIILITDSSGIFFDAINDQGSDFKYMINTACLCLWDEDYSSVSVHRYSSVLVLHIRRVGWLPQDILKEEMLDPTFPMLVWRLQVKTFH